MEDTVKFNIDGCNDIECHCIAHISSEGKIMYKIGLSPDSKFYTFKNIIDKIGASFF